MGNGITHTSWLLLPTFEIQSVVCKRQFVRKIFCELIGYLRVRVRVMGSVSVRVGNIVTVMVSNF